MSGQSSATPFMKVSDEPHYSSNHSKKGLTFDVLEMIERNSNSIDKLTSLVSKMNMKMDKCETQYKPQVYQGRKRGQNKCDYRPNIYQTRNQSYSRDRNKSYRGRGNHDRNFRSNYRGRLRDNYRWEGYIQRDRHDHPRQDYTRDNYRNNYRQDYGLGNYREQRYRSASRDSHRNYYRQFKGEI